MDQVTVLEIQRNVIEVAALGPRGPQGIQGPPGTTDFNDLTDKPTTVAGYAISDAEKTTNKGIANGYAGLDSGGKVPSAQLPSYVDDVLEYANLAAFPGTGSAGIIYIADDTGKIYRWSGSAYVEISPSPGSTDSVTEGTTNLYFTAARVLATVLTGFSTASSAVVTAADTVLSAIGKLQAQITDLTATVAGKAALASPTFTGTPAAPTATSGTNTTQLATTAFVATAVANLVNTAPGTLDTLKELADALGDDPNYAATTAAAIALKAPLASPALTGNPTAPTPAATDNDTSIATTAFVKGLYSTASLTAGSGWTAGTSPDQPQAIKNGNHVHLDGRVTQTAATVAAATPLATIPAGYRPTRNVFGTVVAVISGGAGWEVIPVSINPADGTVFTFKASVGSVSQISFNSLTFDVSFT
ncbi:hypothetical protein [Rhizobium rhizogenes]|uniref:hypothetical protein n=1 Tax=Rhizobium rhizogenes TaxID=359 RepID=UPI00054FDE15|nr:hypothetical protein [Rhizobium rhizogenes]QUE80979.1 hypothetical protein EML492_03985 [Rhizobium rhizogenes]